MEKNKLKQVIIDQQEQFNKQEDLIVRDINLKYYLKGKEIVVISGIRRCGKSSLLKIISKKIKLKKIFINFDDIRLTDFNLANFQHIEEIAHELYGRDTCYYFLDEIQNIQNWEKWVNNLYSKGIKVFLTGSNSRLLSSEISTFLTGRNKVIKLYPFSFKEFLRFKKISDKIHDISNLQKIELLRIFKEYLNIGGFPVIIKNDDIELSRQYFEDILNKDVLNRYRIKEVKELKDIILFLFSNIGKTYSYSTLKKISGIKSLSTIKNYIDYFQDVFLLYKIARFSFSVKKQKVSSSKIYIADNSFFKTVSFNFSENKGRRVENLVFLSLLRSSKEIFYHSEKKECDFIVKDGLKIKQVLQVCIDLSDPKTRKREIEGLLDAMKKYKLNEGLILTLEDEKEIKTKDYVIKVLPLWKWLLM